MLIPEDALDTVGRPGFSAVYYLNSTGAYVLATSLLRLKDGTALADVPLASTDWLEELRYNDLWYQITPTAVTAKASLQGVSMAFAAQVRMSCII